MEKTQRSSPHIDLELGEGLKYVQMTKNELFLSPATGAQQIRSTEELELFLRGANTTKLGETPSLLLGQDAPAPLLLAARPEKVVDVETLTSKTLLGFPIHFDDAVSTRVDIRRAPEVWPPLTSGPPSSVLRTDLRFSFEERVVQRFYVGYFDIWSGLGGLLAAVLVIVSLFSFVCVARYTWNLSRMIQRKNVHKLRKAEIKRLMALVPELKRRLASVLGQSGQSGGDLEKAGPRKETPAMACAQSPATVKADLALLDQVAACSVTDYHSSRSKLKELRALFRKYYKEALAPSRAPRLYDAYLRRMGQSMNSVS